MVHRILQAYI